MARGLEYMERPPDMAANPVEQQPMQQAPAPRGGGGGGGSPELIKPMEDLYVTGQDAEGNDLLQEYYNQLQELNRFVTMNAARGLDPTNPSNLDANNPEASRLIMEFNQRKAQVDALGNELKRAQENYTQVRDKELEGKIYVGDGVQQGQIFGNQQAEDAARRQTERREVDDYIEFYNKNTPKTRAELEAQQRYYQSSKAAVDSLFAKGEIDRDEYNAMINLLPKPQDSLQVKETDSVTDTTKSTTGSREVLDTAARGDINFEALGFDLARAFNGAERPTDVKYLPGSEGKVETYTGGMYAGRKYGEGTVQGVQKTLDRNGNVTAFEVVVQDGDRTYNVPLSIAEDGTLDIDRSTATFAREAGQEALHEEKYAPKRVRPDMAGVSMNEFDPEVQRMLEEESALYNKSRAAMDREVAGHQRSFDDLISDRLEDGKTTVGSSDSAYLLTDSNGDQYLVKGSVDAEYDSDLISADDVYIKARPGSQIIKRNPDTGKFETPVSQIESGKDIKVGAIKIQGSKLKKEGTTNRRTGAPAATARRGGVTPTQQAEVNDEMEEFGFSP